MLVLKFQKYFSCRIRWKVVVVEMFYIVAGYILSRNVIRIIRRVARRQNIITFVTFQKEKASTKWYRLIITSSGSPSLRNFRCDFIPDRLNCCKKSGAIDRKLGPQNPLISKCNYRFYAEFQKIVTFHFHS